MAGVAQRANPRLNLIGCHDRRRYLGELCRLVALQLIKRQAQQLTLLNQLAKDFQPIDVLQSVCIRYRALDLNLFQLSDDRELAKRVAGRISLEFLEL